MNFEQLVDIELANLNKKLSSKKKLRDIGVYEDVLGAKAIIERHVRDKQKEIFAFGESSESEDDDDDKSDVTNEADDCSQSNAKRNLLDVDLHELLNAGARATETAKKAALLIEDVPGLEDIPTYIDMNLKRGTGVDETSRKLTSVDKLLQKSVIQPGFEKQHAIPYETSEKRLRLERKKQRDRTKGAKWFNMSAPELTDEARNDLMVIQMRTALDPKHFYKKNDLKVLPKYFQVGKVVDAPEDFYSSRIPKKQRKKTIVDELLADAEFKKYNKRRYLEIIAEKKRTHHKAHKHAQRLKRKGKKK